jgi:phosphoenolpyruvate synthase/pyruvate phosphate dikinase
MVYLHPFNDSGSAETIGSKAHRLSILYRQGFNVPFGLVLLPTAWQQFLHHNPNLKKAITHQMSTEDQTDGMADIRESFVNSTMPEALKNELNNGLNQLKALGFRKVAVRSSGTLEDGTKTSFAGQFDTFLDIETPEQLFRAVIDCWLSMFGDRVIAYCIHNQIVIGDIALAVVIQGQIDAEKSGVVFTANPMTGNDKEMVIEAICGMGEQMVQGTVTPYRYHYHWFDETTTMVHHGDNCADPSGDTSAQVVMLDLLQIKALATTCLEIQQHFGEPLDIEWAWAANQLFILQARPLTAIQFDTPYEWTNADLKDGGISSSVTTPMMYSLYEHIFELTMPGYLSSTRVLHGKPIAKWFTWWFGYCYWNITGVKESLKRLPGFQERTFDEGLGIEPDYEGPGYTSKPTPLTLIRGIRALLATRRSIRIRPSACKEAVRKTREIFAALESINPDQLTLEQLIAHLDASVHQHYTLVEGAYFYTIYDNSNAASFFQERLKKYNKKSKEPIHYLNLISGLSNLSHLRPVFDLWDISRKILLEEENRAFYQQQNALSLSESLHSGGSFPLSDALRSYIRKYSHHSYKELDITIPNWDEDATQVAELLLQFIQQKDEDDPRRASQQQQLQVQLSKEKLKNNRLQKELAHHRHLLWWREEMRDNSSKMYNYLRKTILAIGRKLTEAGILHNPNDVFMLTFQELTETNLAAQKGAIQHKVAQNRAFYMSFTNFNKPNEILHGHRIRKRRSTAAGAQFLKGIAGSSGIVQGRARVITSVYEAVHLEKGEILVTPFTDPAWTSWFTMISALVTETGGVLSHGAVVSREYGIPAVLGLRDATQLIRTGDLIEVDGNEGRVIFIR